MLHNPNTLDLLEAVHLGHTVEWHGNNLCGCLDEGARAASDQLDQIFGAHDNVDLITFWSCAEWISGASISDLWESGDSLGQAVEKLEAQAPKDDVTLSDDGMKYALLDKLLDEYEAGNIDELTALQRVAVGESKWRHAERLKGVEAALSAEAEND